MTSTPEPVWDELATKLAKEGRVTLMDVTYLGDRAEVKAALDEMCEVGWAKKSPMQDGVYLQGDMLEFHIEASEE